MSTNRKGAGGHQLVVSFPQVTYVDVAENENFCMLLEFNSCILSRMAEIGVAKVEVVTTD